MSEGGVDDGGSLGGEDVSDEAINDVLENAVFRYEKRKVGRRGKRWCVVGLSAGKVHDDVLSKFGRTADDTKRELARTLIKTYGTTWRNTFETEGDE